MIQAQEAVDRIKVSRTTVTHTHAGCLDGNTSCSAEESGHVIRVTEAVTLCVLASKVGWPDVPVFGGLSLEMSLF